MIFSERLKQEREKRGWSQTDLAEKIHVSHQLVSKWETGENYPSIEALINLSDLFGITIDELLRSDEELEEKVNRDRKREEYTKSKVFYYGIALLGIILLMVRIIIERVIGLDIEVLTGIPKVISNHLPGALIVVGAIVGAIGSSVKK